LIIIVNEISNLLKGFIASLYSWNVVHFTLQQRSLKTNVFRNQIFVNVDIF